jgi:rhamnopyranosyl-N-acetylglucosaminyl-diphospho-decaprenol beta-1,3/1,4-galactofuranosyltransferase
MNLERQPSGVFVKKPYFSALDGLRAISVFLVISYHVRTKSPWLAQIPGQLGVDIFFVISGFLITTLLLREQETSGTIDLVAFYTRRVFRIVPVYLLVLGVYVAGCYYSPSKWQLLKSALPHYLTFTNEFVHFDAPYGSSWTLGIEEKFYLLWPLLYFVVLRGRARLIAIMSLYPLLIGLLSFRMGRSYSGLLVGCALAIFLSGPRTAGLRRVLSDVPVSMVAGTLILGFYLVSRDERFTFLFSWMVGALVASLQLNDSWLRRALSAEWLTWIGRRSYGMYLIHGLVLGAVESIVRPTNSARQVSTVVLTFAASASIAEPIFRFVEEPARRYGKALIERRVAKKSRASEGPRVSAGIARRFQGARDEGSMSMRRMLPEFAKVRVAAVVVTYNRKQLLCECIDALLAQSSSVTRIVLIDNASTDGTAELLSEKGYFESEILDYTRMPVNTGGAGGFHEGVRRAYEQGYDWLWLMDDDVEPVPHALCTMLSYSNVSECIQACKVFKDGESEGWESWASIDESGRRTTSVEQNADYIVAETGCFEGMLINRRIVSEIGFPDRRFFIGGDDVAYGYLASRHTQVIYIREPCFLKKINKFGYPRLLQRIRDRFLNRRSSRFYFLCVRNEILLYGYMRDRVRASRFSLRIGKILLVHSVTTLIFERSVVNFGALWKGTFQGYGLLNSPLREFDVKSL